MKPVNSSHLAKYCEKWVSNSIMNMISKRINLDMELRLSKVTYSNDVEYFREIKTFVVEVDQAVKVFEKLLKNPPKKGKIADYPLILSILDKVWMDRFIYGDQIPDTTDVFKSVYCEVPIYAVDRQSVESRLLARKLRQREFVAKFNKAKCIWK